MKRLFHIITLLLMLAVLTNCQKDSDNGLSIEEDESLSVQQLVSEDDEDMLYDLGIDDKSEDNMYDGYSTFNGDLGKITASIDTVLRFGRRIEDRGLRRMDIRRIAPDTFKVFIAREFAGAFVIFEKGDDSTGTRPIIVHRKRLRHVVRRNAIYVKRDVVTDAANELTDRHRRNWKLAGVSMGAGNSVPHHTIQINEVTVNSSSGTSMVITDPLNTLFFSRKELPTFEVGDSVTVQVKLTNTTANPVDIKGNGSTEIVLLHFGTNRDHHARKRFRYVGTDPATGDNVYEGSWTVRQRPGRAYHAIIDAIDNGSIYESAADQFPYNSTTLSTPYRVGVVD